MDIKKFELTERELASIMGDFNFWSLMQRENLEECQKLCQTQVAKVLSMLEPVELEALGDEELKEAVDELYNAAIYAHTHKYSIPHGKQEVKEKAFKWFQATVQHNQAKGQLYRIRSEQEGMR